MFERYVGKNSGVNRLTVTDRNYDHIDNRILLVIAESSAYTFDGENIEGFIMGLAKYIGHTREYAPYNYT